MATVELKPAALWALVMSWVIWFVNQLLQLAWVGVGLGLFVWVAGEYGFRIPYLYVAANPATWIYAAGILWLLRNK